MRRLMESTEQSQELRAGPEPASSTEPNSIPTFNESNKEPDAVGVTPSPHQSRRSLFSTRHTRRNVSQTHWICFTRPPGKTQDTPSPLVSAVTAKGQRLVFSERLVTSECRIINRISSLRPFTCCGSKSRSGGRRDRRRERRKRGCWCGCGSHPGGGRRHGQGAGLGGRGGEGVGAHG